MAVSLRMPVLPVEERIIMRHSFMFLFYGLLSVSSALSAVGCFMLARRHSVYLGLINALLFFSFSAMLVAYLVPFIGIKGAYPYPYPAWLTIVTNSFPYLFFGMLMAWGMTLWILRQKTGFLNLTQHAGVIFAIAGALGFVFAQGITYFGLQFWFPILGLPYCAGALMTTVLLFRISKPPSWRQPVFS